MGEEKSYNDAAKEGLIDKMSENVVLEYLSEESLKVDQTVSEFMTMSSENSIVYEMERELERQERI